MAHLPLKKLLAFHYNQLSTAEKEDAQAHLDACDSCEKNLTLLVKPEQMLKTKPASTGTRVTEQSICLPPEMIGKYINHELLPVEMPPIEKHLASCENCRHLFVAIAQCCTEPVSAETRKIIGSISPRKTSEHVNAIRNLISPKQTPKPIPPNPRPWVDWFIPGARVPWPAYIGTVLLFFSIAGGPRLLNLYRYSQAVAESEKQLVAQYEIFYQKTVRPADRYLSSSTSIPLSPLKAGEKLPPLEALLLEALSYNNEGQAARINLVEYYIFEKKYIAADSLLKVLEATAPQNAAVRNVRGIWFFNQQQYAAAATAFASALAEDPQFEVALYNLAVTQTQLGHFSAAHASWEKYLARPNLKPEWHNAAKKHLRNLP